jgi:hypothetical protein|tara:strand:+ start:373 stop:480 length:108 start_codon:yes stop_codon:yes gene_type:complete
MLNPQKLVSHRKITDSEQQQKAEMERQLGKFVYAS